MGKKVKMVAKATVLPTKEKSEIRELADDELEELCTSLVEALNSKYSSLEKVLGQDVLKSLSIVVAVFFMHQAELTSAETSKDKKLLYEAIIEDFSKRLNALKKELVEGCKWPD